MHFEEYTSPNKITKKVTLEASPEGGRYTGEKQKNNREGLGECTYPDGTLYRGNWEDDKRQGDGKLFNSKMQLLYEG